METFQHFSEAAADLFCYVYIEFYENKSKINSVEASAKMSNAFWEWRESLAYSVYLKEYNSARTLLDALK